MVKVPAVTLLIVKKGEDDQLNERSIRCGILGCQNIARKFATDLQFVEGAQLTAIGSRDKAVAEQFGREFGVSLNYGHAGYFGLAYDSDVDGSMWRNHM